jgi:peroxiredoxin
LSDISSAGATVLAVSVDTIEENARLADALGLEFPILSDVQEEAIREWGLVHENAKPGGGAIARPGVFLVEPDGTISWRRMTDDYRVRLRPEDVLNVLRSRD